MVLLPKSLKNDIPKQSKQAAIKTKGKATRSISKKKEISEKLRIGANI